MINFKNDNENEKEKEVEVCVTFTPKNFFMLYYYIEIVLLMYSLVENKSLLVEMLFTNY